jgi:ABC-type antimicrobial peptide transport system permease subunit
MSQFLVESVLLSLAGGIIGIVLALSLTLSVRALTSQVRVPISPLSVIVAFSASFAVGAAFRLLSALCAAQLSPTQALRYE